MAQLQPQRTTTNRGAVLTSPTPFPDPHRRPSAHQHALATAVGLHLIPGASMVLFFIVSAPLLIQAGLPPVWALRPGPFTVHSDTP